MHPLLIIFLIALTLLLAFPLFVLCALRNHNKQGKNHQNKILRILIFISYRVENKFDKQNLFIDREIISS